MGLFSKRKEAKAEIEVAIRKIVDEDGDKYMHIGDFIHLLEQYGEACDAGIDKGIIYQLIAQLKTA